MRIVEPALIMDCVQHLDVPVEGTGGDVGANDAVCAHLNASAMLLLLSDHFSLRVCLKVCILSQHC